MIISKNIVCSLYYFVLVGVSAWGQCAELPKSIIVITSNQSPVSEPTNLSSYYQGWSPDIKILNLDAVSDLEKRLAKDLPVNEAKAREVLDQRFKLIGKNQLQKDFSNAYQALVLSAKYGIDRYPAVIFDYQTIVYGVTDILAATMFYLEWQKEQAEVGIND